MDPNFWMGFFAMVTALGTSISTSVKNYAQDKAAAKRDLRINTLEVEVRLCHEERRLIVEELKRMRDKSV